MERRRLGRSNIEVSVIGFGAWGIGGLTANATSYGATDDSVSRRALEAAFACGITFFDTAPAYGNGHSERLIGDTFANRRGEITIATKGGMRRFDEPPDFSINALHSTLTASLERLRSRYVDLYQLHSPPAAVLNAPNPINDLIDGLRQEGRVRAFGVSVQSPEDGIRAMERFDIDTIQANFSLVDQRAIDCGLMEAAEARDIAIIARTPLCYGLLSGVYDGDTRFAPTDHRSQWPKEQIARWSGAIRRFAASANEGGSQSGAQLALRYCLSFPAVSTTIPGMMCEDEVRENTAAAALGPLSSDELNAMREIYRSQSFFVGAKRLAE